MSDKLLAATKDRYEALTRRRLVLYAGANLPSQNSQAAYSPALSAYPAMGATYAKIQPDTHLVSELELEVSAAVCSLFKGRWAEVRLPSCTLANLSVYLALTSPGDLMLTSSENHGGHLSQTGNGTPSIAGLRTEVLSFEKASCIINPGRAASQIRKQRPKLVMLGRSVMVRADNISLVTEAAKEVGALTIYDASHVIGLIAGGTFPNPLEFGADVITSSTYKTLRGRPHGLIIGRDKQIQEKIKNLVSSKILANYDAGRIASLPVTLEEAKRTSSIYARTIVENTFSLSQALRGKGFRVHSPEQQNECTHQLLIPLAEAAVSTDVVSTLEQGGILVGTCHNPVLGGKAVRVGTQFLTTIGFQPHNMECVAALLSRAFTIDNKGLCTPNRSADWRTVKEAVLHCLAGIASQ